MTYPIASEGNIRRARRATRAIGWTLVGIPLFAWQFGIWFVVVGSFVVSLSNFQATALPVATATIEQHVSVPADTMTDEQIEKITTADAELKAHQRDVEQQQLSPQQKQLRAITNGCRAGPPPITARC
jgi:hypothetical protein